MSNLRLGSLPRRFVANLLDGLVLLVFYVLVQVLGLGVFNNELSFLVGYFLVAWSGSVLYFACTESSSWQASPGKRAMGLKVVGAKGRALSFQHALGRAASKVLLSTNATLGIGLLVALFSDKRQALHDMLAKTLVVEASQRSNEVDVSAPDSSLLSRPLSGQVWILDGADVETGQEYVLEWDERTSPSVIVGRSASDADICIENPTVSRQHARLSRARGSVVVVDLNSSNGTRIGRRVLSPEREVALPEGGTVMFGNVSLTLRRQ